MAAVHHRVAYPIVLAAGIAIGILTRSEPPPLVVSPRAEGPRNPSESAAARELPEPAPPLAEPSRREDPARLERFGGPAAAGAAAASPPLGSPTAPAREKPRRCEECRERARARREEFADQIAANSTLTAIRDPALRERIAAKLGESDDAWSRVREALSAERDRAFDQKIAAGKYWKLDEPRPAGGEKGVRAGVITGQRALHDGSRVYVELAPGEAPEHDRLLEEFRALRARRSATVLELLVEESDEARDDGP